MNKELRITSGGIIESILRLGDDLDIFGAMGPSNRGGRDFSSFVIKLNDGIADHSDHVIALVRNHQTVDLVGDDRVFLLRRFLNERLTICSFQILILSIQI